MELMVGTSATSYTRGEESLRRAGRGLTGSGAISTILQSSPRRRVGARKTARFNVDDG